MSELANESVQCVPTSPPFWGLRKYSGEQELVWGDNHCEHEWGNIKTLLYEDDKRRWQHTGSGSLTHKGEVDQGTFCQKCNAWRGSYGLEPTPELYIQHSIEILREIRRVLRKDGVVFWNIGDSYGGSGKGPDDKQPGVRDYTSPPFITNIIKPKDLCLIPFRMAIAAQEDGWWVRSVIIWSKPNPMPESVTDRPTESHEYILMLTKSARYYWDKDAVREPLSAPERYETQLLNYDNSRKWVYGEAPNTVNPKTLETHRLKMLEDPGRNIRSVWTITTQPYPEAHFAVFPEAIPEKCIKAATPEMGCCSKCGAPQERVSDNTLVGHTKITGLAVDNFEGTKGRCGDVISHTRGWQPTCKCNTDSIPSLVLDPFMGSGTTLWMAKKLNRRAVGYDISEEYCQLALDRNRQMALGLV